MGDRRLTPADAAWLYSEWDKNPQTVSALMWLDRQIDPARFFDIVSERMLERYPTFHQRIRKSRNPLMMPHWEDDPDFDIGNHVEVIQLPAPGDKTALQAYMAVQMLEAYNDEKVGLADVPISANNKEAGVNPFPAAIFMGTEVIDGDNVDNFMRANLPKF